MSKSTFRLTEALVIAIACVATILLIAPTFIGESLATEPGKNTQPATQPASKVESPFTRLRRQRKDMDNLRGIYIGIMGYAAENDDKYPSYSRLTFKAQKITHAQGFRPELRQAIMPHLSSKHPAVAGNISAALWLLLREDHLPVKIFVNPNSQDTPDPMTDSNDEKVTPSDLYDFASPSHCSYSFINFYHNHVRSKWSNSSGPTFVLAANDNNNDFTKAQPTDYDELNSNKSMNSLDHGGKGMNILFADGHAQFFKHPVAALNYTDNVYTFRDKENELADGGSIKTLAKKNWARITSTGQVVTVHPLNNNKDVFLLPVDSLVKKNKK